MKKRSKFWTVVFSFLPGAGHMFMGFMKTGVSFMGLFFGAIFLASFLRLDELLFLIPILWFYSFFDCINKRFSSDEAFEQMEDRYVLWDKVPTKTVVSMGKRKVAIGVGAVVVGIYLLLEQLMNIIYPLLPGRYDNLFYVLRYQGPRLIIAVAIIVLGIWLIRGKRKEMTEDDQA